MIYYLLCAFLVVIAAIVSLRTVQKTAITPIIYIILFVKVSKENTYLFYLYYFPLL